ncbi:MAG: hypothetical protein K0Q91_966 [Fibrobacteria bacterium]|jgi:hypothetical protein|nr:hypothetical protein [Fibrobacteria bacterium]
MRFSPNAWLSFLLAGACAPLSFAQGTPGGTTGPIGHNDTRVHPGFTMTNLIPAGSPANWPRVGGLDFLPSGDLVVSTWDGFGNSAGTTHPGRVFIFKKVTTGDSTQVTYTQLGANDMNEPLGVKVVDGEIYIIEKDSLVHLVDANKDQVLDSKRRIASGWTRNLGDNSGKDLQFMHGLVRTPAGKFIAGMATRWNGGPVASTGTNANHDGCIISMELTRTDYDVVACGIRSPDGIVIGPEDGIFVTDNNGNYVPASKLVHVKPGRFFNVIHSPASPFDTVPVTRPVLWLPHGNDQTNVSVSPTQPVYLRTGVFKGQMLAGDNNMGTLQRYFLERVGGEYQGAVVRFSGGIRAAAHRIIVGPDSALYVGGIGATNGEWGGWAWASRQHGLQRMKENGQPFFDVLAVRSTSATTFELEFTEPLVSAAASNFTTVQQWGYVPVQTYGAGKQTTETLTLESVVLSADKKKVTLTIPGLKRSNVVHLRWSGLTAESGRPLMTDRTWYTLNEFGPAEVVAVRPEGARARARLLASAQALSDGRLEIHLPAGKAVAVAVYDLRGAVLEAIPSASGRLVTRTAFKPGIYTVVMGSGAERVSRRITVF